MHNRLLYRYDMGYNNVMSEELTNKHDEIARQFLSNVEVARDFLSLYLPKDILQKCDLSTINIESGSYIEHNLKKRYSDVVYRIDLYPQWSQSCRCIYIYTLVEHQSTPRKIMPLTITHYLLSILHKHIEKYPDDVLVLPLVLPLVFYHGEESPYPYPCDIADMFADKELYQKAPLGTFGLIDLTVKEDEELLRHKKLALLEVTLKNIRKRDFNQAVDGLVQALQIAHAENINDSLVDGFISYLANAKESQELIPLFKKIKKEVPFYEDKIMTYAEELEQRGKQRGEQIGEQKAKREIAKELLKSGVSDSVIATATHLTLDQIKSLK